MSRRVALIVLNYNGLQTLGPRLLKECLRSILNTDYENFVVIFTDNGSIDKSASFVRKEFIQYINASILYILELNENYGWSGGNNRGAIYALKYFNPDYIAFLNNDIYVTSRSWLRVLVEAMQAYNIHIACPLIYEVKRQRYSVGDIVLNDGRSVPVEFAERELKRILSKNIRVLKLPAVHGAAMVVKSEVFKALKGFDEGFRAYYDETDFCFRARRKGYQVAAVLDLRTKVLHLGGLTIERMRHVYNKKVRYIVESSLRFTCKHYGPKSLLQCFLSSMRWLIAEFCRLNVCGMLGIAFGLINGMRRLNFMQ